MTFMITCNLSDIKQIEDAVENILTVVEEAEGDCGDRMERYARQPLSEGEKVDASLVFENFGRLGLQIRDAWKQVKHNPGGRKFIGVSIVFDGESELSADCQSAIEAEFIELATRDVLWGVGKVFDEGDGHTSVTLSGVIRPQQQKKVNGGGTKLPDPESRLELDEMARLVVVPA